MDFEANLFEKVKQHHTLQGDQGQYARLEVVVSPKKGFLLEKGVWINYRRNYFEIDCLVSLAFPSGSNSPKLYLDNQVEVLAFRVAISANYCDGQDIGLVQFTAQRQKDKNTSPTSILLLLSKGPSKAAFKRLQFRQATPNNNSHMREKGSYRVRIQILADLINSQAVVIAETQSAPILVRGRSPIHYSRKAAGQNTNPSTPRGSNSPSEFVFQGRLESLVCHENPKTLSLPRSKKGLLDFILN